MSSRTLLLSLVGGALLATSLDAADNTLEVRCGTLLDPGSRSAKSNVKIFFEGGRVARSSSESSSVLDLSAYTCLPGLIDAHTHLLLQGDATSEEYDEQVLKESTPYRALRAAAAGRIALDNGFTTVRDLGTEGAGFTDVDLKKAFDRGIVPGPRVVTAGPAMTPTGRYPLLGFSWERKMPDGVLKCDGADECRKGVRWQAQYGVDWIKVYADGSYYRTPDGGWASVPNFTQDEMNAIVDEAHRLRKKVAAHSMTPTGHRIALAAGVDSIEHGDVLDDETVKSMLAKKVAYCPTISALDWVKGPRSKTNPVWDQLWAASEESFRRAHKAGVTIVFGTDAGAFEWDRRNAAVEFSFMTAWGMAPWDALRTATTVAGELLGPQKDGRLGCLGDGCVADLVAVKGDPLQDIRVMEKTVAVISRGKVVKKPD